MFEDTPVGKRMRLERETTPRRLAAAYAANSLQAEGANSRLTYSLVSLDGKGRLIEVAEEAKKAVDRELVSKLAKKPGFELSKVLNRRIHAMNGGVHSHAGATGRPSRSSLGGMCAGRESMIADAHPATRRRAASVAPLAQEVDVHRVVVQTSDYESAVAAMENQPYEEVVASHPVFVSAMREALSAPLDPKLVEMFTSQEPPRSQVNRGVRSSCKSGKAHAADGSGQAVEPMGTASSVRGCQTGCRGVAMQHRILEESGMADTTYGRFLRALEVPLDLFRSLHNHKTTDKTPPPPPRPTVTAGAGQLVGGVELGGIASRGGDPSASAADGSCAPRRASSVSRPSARTASFVDVDGGGGPSSSPSSPKHRASNRSSSPSTQAAEWQRMSDSGESTPPPSVLKRVLSRQKSRGGLQLFLRSSRQMLSMLPFEAKFRGDAKHPDSSTTLEELLLTPEKFSGVRANQGGLGAHGETAFLLCALKNGQMHRVIMLFLLTQYFRREVGVGQTLMEEQEDAGEDQGSGDGLAGRAWRASTTNRGHRPSLHASSGSTRAEQLSKLVNASYAGPQFHGETALHFAVMRGDMRMVELLIRAGANVDAHADGLFFYERMSVYCGGRPVGLAAMLGNQDMLDFLADKGADLHFVDMGCLCTFEPPPDETDEWAEWFFNYRRLESASLFSSMGPDLAQTQHGGATHVQRLATKYLLAAGLPFCSQGNTILHVCTIHDRPLAFENLVRHHGVQTNLRNGWNQTPLSTAAFQGTCELFQTALECTGRTLWVFGELSCFEFPLLEIDTQLEAQNDELPSILRILVEQKRTDLLRFRQISQLIIDKWRRFARVVFRLQATTFLATLVCLHVHVDCAADESECRASYVALLVLVTLLILFFLPTPSHLCRRIRRLCCCRGRDASAGGRHGGDSDAAVRASGSSSSSGKRQLLWREFVDFDDLGGSDSQKRWRSLSPTIRWLLGYVFSTASFALLVYASLLVHPSGLVRLWFPHFWQQSLAFICVGADGDGASNATMPATTAATADGMHQPCSGGHGILTSNIVLGAASLVGWSRFVSHVAATHKRFGPFIVIMTKMLLKDVARVAIFGACLVISFATAIVAASRTFSIEPSGAFDPLTNRSDGFTIVSWQKNGIAATFDVVGILVRAPFDDTSYLEDTLLHPLPALSKTLLAIYVVLVCLVLVNLLIAMLTTTYNRILNISDLEWYWQFSDLVLQLERTWLGELLRPRQLLRWERCMSTDGQLQHRAGPVQNIVDGYHWGATVPQPVMAAKVAHAAEPDVSRARALSNAERRSVNRETAANSPYNDAMLEWPVQTWWYRLELMHQMGLAPSAGGEDNLHAATSGANRRSGEGGAADELGGWRGTAGRLQDAGGDESVTRIRNV
jgi:hypothetical protein